MASSAKFLEEALSTDVDESAVGAIVGSLENQLVTSAPLISCQQVLSSCTTSLNQNNFTNCVGPVSNGNIASVRKYGIAKRQPNTMNIILNTDTKKGIVASSAHQSGNITQTISNSNLQTVVSCSNFLNQITSNVGLIQTTGVANLAKVQDGLKIVYPSSQAANTNATRVTYPMQTVNSLPNGNLNVLNVSNSNLQNMVSHTYSQAGGNVHKISNIGIDHNKPGTTSFVIKSNNIQSAGVNSPISTSISLSGAQMNTSASSTNNSAIVTLAKTLNSVGNSPTVVNAQGLPANVQIVNVNTVRANNPSQQGNKNVTPRLMIPQMVGTRSGQPGQITLQALQGLQTAQGGHLLLKTENGQYQLLRVGPVPTQSSAHVTNSTTSVPAQNFRLQAVPACTISSTGISTNVVTTTTAPITVPSTVVQQQPAAPRVVENSKDKCRKFLANLLELSSKEPKAVEKNVRTLIQELVDAKVEPEEFCDRLEKLLNASPQPCLIGFLKKSLPLLRAALSAKEMTIDGIRPPPAPSQIVTHSPATVMLASPSVVQSSLQSNQQVRHLQLNTMGQVRVVPQSVNSINRPPSQIQHRILTVRSRLGPALQRQPVRVQTSAVSSSVAGMGSMNSAKVMTNSSMPTNLPIGPTTVRITTPITTSMPFSLASASVHTTSSEVITTIVTTTISPTLIPSSPITTSVRVATPSRQPTVKSVSIKPPTTFISPSSAPSNKSVTSFTPKNQTIIKNNQISKPSSNICNKSQSSSSQSKSVQKEKEKKSPFSAPTATTGVATSGFIAEDDVNDVATMAGVNLAEETQRILGSTEFVGTQIRSCKDETFLHAQPLARRIMNIASKFNLSEPPSSDIVSLISHAAEERLKNIAEKLAAIAEHRIDFNKADNQYEVIHDIRGQLKVLEELDKVERKRHDEVERELLLRAAKSRSKSEDPEQVKLKAKAKEMQRAEMEELRQREANVTALLAIGPRKKIKTETDNNSPSLSSLNNTYSSPNNTPNRVQGMNRPRLKRVTLRDYLFLLEHEKDTCKSPFLYKAYFK